MRKVVVLTIFSFSILSFVSAQTSQNRVPAKVDEQRQIKADQHLEKEIQQKQLTAKPEMLQTPVLNGSHHKKNAADRKKSAEQRKQKEVTNSRKS